ncbi:hypothetical protein [Paraglaciecola sp. MB-3u-78]|jgi:hypothetical protein|uniref:hypothetical protein n=1 Tax=Paraglaciecola sp. MB-3u-78 TaxID=2058332 RepID=UPI0012FEE48A|nr:hypothetical protein [Paraglaciecola sp. MB-3u-78]
METGSKALLSAVYQHPQIIETSEFALPDPSLDKRLGQLPILKVLKKLTIIV